MAETFTRIGSSEIRDMAGLRRWIRPALALATIAAAYHTSLRTLFESLRLDTPVAHLALVPLIAVALAWSSRTLPLGPPIHDRQLDWITGLPLVALAVISNLILPARLSTDYWQWRIDLLTLPLFTTGVAILVFGARHAWRARRALLFLFLAWPFPYNSALERWLGRFTQMTVSALERALSILPVARRVPGLDSVFEVAHGDGSVQMMVASACSGANGMVGFFLVGLAFVMVIEGRRWRKALWLASGLVVVWMLNVVRILVIFLAAGRWGQRVAIEGFHPFVGLVSFNLGIALMVLVMRRFGLRFRSVAAVRSRGRATGQVEDNEADLAEQPARPAGVPRHRPPLVVAGAVVVVTGMGLGFLNNSLSDNDLISNNLGAPRLAAFASDEVLPSGWDVGLVGNFDWARRFFGNDSAWKRYQYRALDINAPLYSNVPINLDVVETADRASLSAYGIEACYQFHGYAISGIKSIELGAGVVGGLLTWTNRDTELTYTTLYWHWPIVAADGGVRYERMVLIVQDDAGLSMRGPAVSSGLVDRLQTTLNDALRDNGTSESRKRLLGTRTFLVGFAQQLIADRATAAQ